MQEKINKVSAAGWKTTRKLGTNPIAFAILCRALNQKFGTCAELAELVGISPQTCRLWLDLLHKMRCIYIYDWRQSLTNYQYTAIYTWNLAGHHEDAKKPPALTSAQQCKAYRERKKRKEGKS